MLPSTTVREIHYIINLTSDILIVKCLNTWSGGLPSFSTESPFSVQYLFSTSATYKSLAKSFVSVLFLKKDDVNGI